MKNFAQWVVENQSLIESVIIAEAIGFVNSLCEQYSTTKTLMTDISHPTGWVRLGVAKSTRHRDACCVRSSGLRYDGSSGGIPKLHLTFVCFQGGGMHHSWNSYETVRRLWEEGGTFSSIKQHEEVERKTVPKAIKNNIINECYLKEKNLASAYARYKLLQGKPKKESLYLVNKKVNDIDCDYHLDIDSRGEWYAAFPLRDISNKFKGIQRIYDNGVKIYTPYMEKKGAFFIIGGTGGGNEQINICEGVATGLTIKKGIPNSIVVCAMDSGNIIHVTRSIIEYKPELRDRIVIRCDNDRAGITKGVAAAKEFGGLAYSIPSADGADYNDIYQQFGVETLKSELNQYDKR